MANDFEIGRVVAVDTTQVTIELSPELRSFTRSTFEGVEEIGRINSYVVVPVGARRLVAMVTKVTLTEEAEIRADRTMVSLPSAKRIMRATLIGSLEGRSFRQGVSTFPILDNPVLLAGNDDLDAMFDSGTAEEQDPTKPGYCVEIGESAVLEGHSVKIDPDAMFGKHLAVLGSTGSGKSCTVATIIQAILKQPKVKRTNFIILDTNGEYRAAFQRSRGEAWEDIGGRRCQYVPSGSADADRLTIPYWFLDADDFVRLFRASSGTQRPVLLEALRLARNVDSCRSSMVVLREELVREFNRILALASASEKTSKDVRDCAVGLNNRICENEFDAAWAELETQNLAKSAVVHACEAVSAIAGRYVENGVYPKVLPADARAAISREAMRVTDALTCGTPGGVLPAGGVSADAPAYFDKNRFRSVALEQVLQRQESGGARARDYSGTMLLRIDRLVADRRFEFLLGPIGMTWPRATHALAAFLRDALGLASCDDPQPALSDQDAVREGSLPFYDRQRSVAGPSNVVILDLSLLASEVLDNVTALIGRLVLEFLQRLGESGEGKRGSLPVVMVLDEAQNYIGEQSSRDDESIARAVFERVAREGRKFGLGLVVASQRPSELSKTVLSQCSSFIVHRLQNPEDLRYFREVVPAIYGDLLGQLPALAPQTALVLGECVRAPALVRMREADPLPRSKDPRFWAAWASDEAPSIDVEGICAEWEGGAESLLCDADQGEGLKCESEPASEPNDAPDFNDDIPF